VLSKVLYVLGILWVLGIFIWVIRDRKWLGVLQCGVIVVASGLAVCGDRFGFNGRIAAAVFVGVVVGTFSAIKAFRKRNTNQGG
jgi:hypothetical protein